MYTKLAVGIVVIGIAALYFLGDQVRPLAPVSRGMHRFVDDMSRSLF